MKAHVSLSAPFFMKRNIPRRPSSNVDIYFFCNIEINQSDTVK